LAKAEPPKQTEDAAGKRRRRRVEILERRLQNPFGEPSSPIELTDATMVPRIFNKAKGTQAIADAQDKGWEFVPPEMIADIDRAAGFRISTCGKRMVNGEREELVLMYMPRDVREEIEQAKAKKNVRDMQMGRQKDAIVHAAAQRFGGEAGEFLNKGRIVGEVTDKIARMHATEDPAGSLE